MRNIGILSGCQALFFCANAMIISTTALVGQQIAPSSSLATLPLGLQFLATMASTMTASLLMARVGRRTGLMIGGCFAVLSGLIGWHAIMTGSFVPFSVSAALYGVFAAFAAYYRFAAADAADPPRTARAISYVLAGGVVAGVLGPELAKRTLHLFDPILFAGTYLFVGVLGAMTVVLLFFLTIPKPRASELGGEKRPLSEIARQPTFILAVAAAITAYVVMNLLMTATPLAMVACGFGFEQSAFVIQGHVLGMFAPSFFTGHLISRFGTMRVIGAGAGLLMGCIALHLSGIELVHFTLGLIALGVGWNFMFIGATALLTHAYRPAEKAKVQGLNDLLLFFCVALSATSSGALHEWIGWQAMNLIALVMILSLTLVLLTWRPKMRVAGAV